jgi:hypothetical protein
MHFEDLPDRDREAAAERLADDGQCIDAVSEELPELLLLWAMADYGMFTVAELRQQAKRCISLQACRGLVKRWEQMKADAVRAANQGA